MFSRAIFFINTRTASVIMLCAFAFLVSSQSLKLTHEFTHIEHEQTELCEILHSFGSNTAVIAHQVGPQFFLHSQLYFATLLSSLVDKKPILNQRSRAPPLLSLS